MEKNGFFDAVSGNRSSARLMGFIIISVALIFAQEVLYFGKDNVILAAAAAGTMFITIAGPTLIYLYQNKQTEVNHEEAKQETAAITKTEIPIT